MILAFARFLMQGRIYFCLGVFFLASLPLMLWLGSAFVVLVTLRRGAFDGALALLCAMLPMALIAVLAPIGAADSLRLSAENMPGSEDIDLLQGLVFGHRIVGLIAAYLASILLRETVRLNIALLAVAITICLVVVGGVLPVQDWADFFKLNYDSLASMLPQNYGKEELSAFEDVKSGELFRIIASHYLSMTLVVQIYLSLLLGRWLQSGLYNPGGFGEEFRSLSYSGLIATLLVVISLMLDKVIPQASGVGWVLTAPLVAVGVAFVHYVIYVKKPSFTGWLIGFYLILPLTYGIVAILGWLDALWHFRSRIKKDMC